MKIRLYLPCVILLLLAACQSEEPATSSVPTSQQTSTPASSTVAVTKEVVETHAKALQAKIEESKEAATKAAEQLTASFPDRAKVIEEGATAKTIEAEHVAEANKAAEAAKVAAAKQAAETAARVSETKHSAAISLTAPLAVAKAQAASIGDAAKGKSLANKCKSCHAFTAKKKMGPGLKAIYGRKAGSMAGIRYSDALAAGGWIWDDKNLAMWLCDSKKAVKSLSGNSSAKTKMSAQRICDATKQADLIAFLKTL